MAWYYMWIYIHRQSPQPPSKKTFKIVQGVMKAEEQRDLWTQNNEVRAGMVVFFHELIYHDTNPSVGKI